MQISDDVYRFELRVWRRNAVSWCIFGYNNPYLLTMASKKNVETKQEEVVLSTIEVEKEVM